jgi:DNA-directed RNA polymerase III subunit RPC1
MSSKYIQFGAMSQQEMAKVAEIEVTQRDLYDVQTRAPIQHGVLDKRLVS